MRNLVFFLEEPSAREMLKGLLPRIIPSNDVSFQYIVFEGKQDLEKRLPKKLKGWCKPESSFIVLCDQDSTDCQEVKKKLRVVCQKNGHPESLIRIACRELESWYLGDLKAVENALELNGLARKQERAKYRTPDNLNNAAQELDVLTKQVYQKVSGSRQIGPYLDLENNRSHSFGVFVNGIMRFFSRKNTREVT